MYSLIALALALTDTSSKVDTFKNVKETPKKVFAHSGRLSLPSSPSLVVLETRRENTPESITTCYSNGSGSCWSENN